MRQLSLTNPALPTTAPAPVRARTFTSPTMGASLRVVVRDGVVWLLSTDACFSLGLRNTARAIGSLAPTQRSTGRVLTHGGRQLLNLISLAGFEALAARSPRPNVAEVVRWVREEVVPSARGDTGATSAPEEPDTASNADAATPVSVPASPVVSPEPVAAFGALNDALRPVVALLGELAGGVAEVRARLGWLEAHGAATARHMERMGSTGRP